MPKKWTQEMLAKAKATREANAAAKAANGRGSNPVAIGNYTKHMAEEVLREMRAGNITLKTLRRRDALILLAYSELHGQF